MSEALNRATRSITEADLPRMVLEVRELPAEFQGFQPTHEGILDNATMAEQGFSGSSAEHFAAIGRLTGYVQEFSAPLPRGEPIAVGQDLADHVGRGRAGSRGEALGRGAGHRTGGLHARLAPAQASLGRELRMPAPAADPPHALIRPMFSSFRITCWAQ